MRVADITTGTAGSEPDHLTLVRDLLFFGADDGESGRELWALALDVRRVYMPAVLRGGRAVAVRGSAVWEAT